MNDDLCTSGREVLTAARVWVCSVIVGLLAVSLGAQTPVCSFQVVNTFPHDPDAFTQGLLYSEGVLFESTGLYEESTLRRVSLETV